MLVMRMAGEKTGGMVSVLASTAVTGYAGPMGMLVEASTKVTVHVNVPERHGRSEQDLTVTLKLHACMGQHGRGRAGRRMGGCV